MTLSQFKFLAPDNPNKATAIINGQSSGILNWNDLKYPQVFKSYKEALGNFWIADEINMTKDAKEWKTKLSYKEKEVLLSIIGLLAILDSTQPRFLNKILDYITDPSIAAVLAVFAQQEVEHNRSYSYILSSIENSDQQNRAFEMARMPEIYKRNELITQVYDEFQDNPTPLTIAKAFVASIVLEGINFYSGFAFFYNLARNQKMVATSTMIGYINRDELLHSRFMCEVLRMILSENPEIDADGLFTKWTYEFIQKAVDLEIEWSSHILKGVDGIDLLEMTDYIQYLANKRLRLLGLDDLYEGKEENCMKWIKAYDPQYINNTKTDFFEGKPRQYTKTSDDNGFDDL